MSAPIEAEVAIVGAGPAGTAAAAHLGQLGVRGGSRQAPLPRDKTCGSGISPRGIDVLRELGGLTRSALRLSDQRIPHRTPSGRETFLSGGAPFDAVVCLRRTLDQLILQRALDTGVGSSSLHRGEVADGPRAGHGRGAADGREVRSRDRDRRRNALPPGASTGAAEDHPGHHGLVEGVLFRQHHVEMVFDPMVLPLRVALPEGGDRVNIGTPTRTARASRTPARCSGASWINTTARRLTEARPIGGWKGHPIAYSYRIERLTSPGRIVIGESAACSRIPRRPKAFIRDAAG